MMTDNLAKRMREEHARVRELTDRIREKTAVVPTANLDHWITEVRDRFEHFRAHMIKQFALEEREGYLTAVLERRPALAKDVERLEHEHREITKLMDGIHVAAGELAGEDRLLIRDCCTRIATIISYVEHHEDEENMLVTHVFTQDIGGHD